MPLNVLFLLSTLARSHVIPSYLRQTQYIGLFTSKACIILRLPSNKCNDSVLSNKISGTLSNPPATSSTVRETTLAFLWCSYGTQMSSWFPISAYITLVNAPGYNNTLLGWKYSQLMYALCSWSTWRYKFRAPPPRTSAVLYDGVSQQVSQHSINMYVSKQCHGFRLHDHH